MADNINPEPLHRVLNILEDVKIKFVNANIKFGGLKRYHAIKKEIAETGWKQICEKYHPDINTDNPAAFELFQFYKFVYSTMDRRD